MKVKDIVNSINNKEPLEMEKAFKYVLSNKLDNALDTKKKEMSKELFDLEDSNEDEDSEGDIGGEDLDVEEAERWSKQKRFKPSQRKKKTARRKLKLYRKKWARSAGGKASERKQKIRQKRIKRGSLRIDPKKAKFRRQVAKTYKGR